MRYKTLFLLLLILSGLLCACSRGPEATLSESVSADKSESIPSLYSDYYTGVPPLIEEFGDFSVDLSADAAAEGEWEYDLCFTADTVYYYELIQTEKPGEHIQNGVIGLTAAGERLRVCPESDCTTETICSHIVLLNESILKHGGFLYICGKPALDNDFYENNCIMRYDFSTREYVKYAEIAGVDHLDCFLYGDTLFAQTLTAEDTAILYAFDLIENRACRLIFHSKAIGPNFLGAANGMIFASDREYLYALDGEGNKVFETDRRGSVRKVRPYGDRLCCKNWDGEIWLYAPETDTAELLVENACDFSLYRDTIYYFPNEKVEGLLYLSPYEGENGHLAYEVVDYPLNYGTSIRSYSLTDGSEAEVLHVEPPYYLSGDLHVSEFGLVYGCFHETEEPQITFPHVVYQRDLDTQEESVLLTEWNGRRKRFGR